MRGPHVFRRVRDALMTFMKTPAALFLASYGFVASASLFGQAQQTPADALQPSKADIPAADPEAERASFDLAPGLEVNLFAADPMLKNPIQIAWDARGRLWVASSETYPQIKPGEPSEDKVIVLEDTDGDGTADTSTVFADNLLIPTGLFPVGPGEAAVLGLGQDDKGSGCYVANSTELIFLRDTDGDGHADTRHVLLSGFGTEDTHHIIHTFRGAPDGGFYFNQSIYIHSHVETPWGIRRLGGGGVWHYRPETGQLEIFTRGQVNPWGHVIDKWGQSFTTDGAYSEGVNYAFPGAAFFWAKEDDWTKDYPRILKGLNPGQPKHSGIEIISGRHFPDDWQGTMVLPDFRGNRINRFVVTDAGSGYASKQVEDLIKTTHRSFRPVDLKMGPDGALYLADWYNPIIQHGEVDFRDDRRDRIHGRIWRVTAKDRPLVERPKIVGASVDELLEMLKAPEDWTRFFAKREIRERAGNVVLASSQPGSSEATHQVWQVILQKLSAVIASVPADQAGPLTLEALWTAQSLGKNVSPFVEKLEVSTEPRLRAAALRFYYRSFLAVNWGAIESIKSEGVTTSDVKNSWSQKFTPVLADPHPRVRLEAIHCLHALHTAKATELALTALDKEMDENLDFALWQTCRDTQDVWLPAFQKGEITFGGNFKHVVFALKATGNPAALQPLVTALREGKINDTDRPAVLELISQMGGPEELALLLERGVAFQATNRGVGFQPARTEEEQTRRLEADTTAAALDLLTQTIRTRKVRPANAEKALSYLDSPEPAVRRAASRLAGVLKLDAAREKLIAQLNAPAPDAADTQAALDGLLALGGEASRSAILHVAAAAEPRSFEATGLAIQAFANIDTNQAAVLASGWLQGLGRGYLKPGEALSSEMNAFVNRLFDAFLTRKDGPSALAKALEGKKVPEVIAQTGLQRASSAGTDTKALQDALAAAAGLKPINQTLTPAEMEALVAEVRAKGDAHRGESVYRRTALLCQTCHAIGGGGPEIGPDLVSIGASAQIDYLIESMLNPGAKIKEGYHTNVITTKSGEVFAGAIVKKDGQTVVLRDAAGQLQNVPALNIATNEIMPFSLMPPGLTASLRKDEFLDLIKFLSELGREGDFKVPPQKYIRRWRALQPSEALGRAHNLQGDRLFASGDAALAWLPLYATASGALPPEDVPRIDTWSAKNVRVLQFDIEVLAAGTLAFALENPASVKFIVGEQIVEAQPRTTLTLPQGLQKVTVFYNGAEHAAPLKLELADDPATTGRARLVTGR